MSKRNEGSAKRAEAARNRLRQQILVKTKGMSQADYVQAVGKRAMALSAEGRFHLAAYSMYLQVSALGVARNDQARRAVKRIARQWRPLFGYTEYPQAHDAIDLLVRSDLHKEALSLVKVWLGADPLDRPEGGIPRAPYRASPHVVKRSSAAKWNV